MCSCQQQNPLVEKRGERFLENNVWKVHQMNLNCCYLKIEEVGREDYVLRIQRTVCENPQYSGAFWFVHQQNRSCYVSE